VVRALHRHTLHETLLSMSSNSPAIVDKSKALRTRHSSGAGRRTSFLPVDPCALRLLSSPSWGRLEARMSERIWDVSWQIMTVPPRPSGSRVIVFSVLLLCSWCYFYSLWCFRGWCSQQRVERVCDARAASAESHRCRPPRAQSSTAVRTTTATFGVHDQ